MKIYNATTQGFEVGQLCDYNKPVVRWAGEELKIDENCSKFDVRGSFRFLVEYKSIYGIGEDDDICLFLTVDKEKEDFNGGENYEIWKVREDENKKYYQVLIGNGGRVSVTHFPIKGTNGIWQNCWFENNGGMLRKYWARCIFSSNVKITVEKQ